VVARIGDKEVTGAVDRDGLRAVEERGARARAVGVAARRAAAAAGQRAHRADARARASRERDDADEVVARIGDVELCAGGVHGEALRRVEGGAAARAVDVARGSA
jgi:hypothetical protein